MLLAGLMVWPAGTAAQETDEEFENRVDPTHVFPQVNRTKYGSNMSMMAVVKRDGTTLSEVSENTIVAVFSGDEIRGKDIIYADQDNMAFVTIYGESTETLTFKVYWDGVVYDCGGSATFASDGFIGATDSPYELDISPVSLADNASNTETLTTWNTKTRDVVLTDRTLYKDGKWNTLCLPFDVTLSGSPLDGAEARTLESASLSDAGELTLNFGNEVTTLSAGVPYIIKWSAAADLVNPVFRSVTVKNTSPTPFTSNGITFVGQYAPFEIVDNDAVLSENQGYLNEIILLGSGNTLGYASALRTLHTFRAHFEVPVGSGAVKAFRMNVGGETSIISIDNGQLTMDNEAGAWYDLSGRKVERMPAQSGIYIKNGRKIVIK